MSLARNASATMPDREDSRFSFTTHTRTDSGDVVVVTEPRQASDAREYTFRSVDGYLVAPRCGTWHVVVYVREILKEEVLTPGISEGQSLITDF